MMREYLQLILPRRLRCFPFSRSNLHQLVLLLLLRKCKADMLGWTLPQKRRPKKERRDVNQRYFFSTHENRFLKSHSNERERADCGCLFGARWRAILAGFDLDASRFEKCSSTTFENATYVSTYSPFFSSIFFFFFLLALVVILIDGMRWDYPDRSYSPQLENMGREGVRANCETPISCRMIDLIWMHISLRSQAGISKQNISELNQHK